MTTLKDMGKIYDIEPPSGPPISTSEAIAMVRALNPSHMGMLIKAANKYVGSVATILGRADMAFEAYPSALADVQRRLEANLLVAQKLRDWSVGCQAVNYSPDNYDEVAIALALASEGYLEAQSLRDLYLHLRDNTLFFDGCEDLSMHFADAALDAAQCRIHLGSIINELETEPNDSVDLIF